MKFLRFPIIYLIAFVTALVVGMEDAKVVSAAEARLVRIWSVGDGELKGFRIDPNALHIDKNTVVLWMSGVRDEEIQIVFESGKACQDVTANPNEKNPAFTLDASNCYVTTIMGFGDTSALEFVDVGKFEYTVQTKEGKVKAVGKICVRENGESKP
jgi:DNA-binding protein YbaB